MKTKYECAYCWSLFSSKEECQEHEEKTCSKNPHVRTCETCKHESSDMGGTGKIYYGCAKKQFKTSPIGYKKNCEKWEWDEGFAH